MTDTTHAATLFGAEDLRVVEQRMPPLADGMVRIRMGAGGICGSDMHYFRHARTGDFVVTSPLVLGHEIAGVVESVNAPGTTLKSGDRVAVNPSRWCGQCRRCRQGRLNLCENIFFMGSASKIPHMQGGFASRFDAIPAQCVRIPPHVSLKAAALSEPLAVCLHAVGRAADRIEGRRGLVLGAGPIGLLTMMVAKRLGLASVAVADIAQAPLSFARRLGADEILDTSGDGGAQALSTAAVEDPFDIVFEATGAAAGLAAAIGAVRRGGTVVQIGNLPGGNIPIPANAVMAKELDLLGTFRFGHEFDVAVDLIARGEIDVMALVTAERPLAEAPQAVRLALDRTQSMKVLLVGDVA